MTKKLKYKSYLAGPMDDVSIDESRDWRDMIEDEFPKMGIACLNPITKYGAGYGAIRTKFAIWQKSGNVDAIRQVVSRQIIPPDLIMVKECDFVTLWIPAEGHEICGSYGEMTHAFYLNKPVYIITSRRLKPLNVPKWAIGCSTKIFKDWKTYLAYIKRVWTDGGKDTDEHGL